MARTLITVALLLIFYVPQLVQADELPDEPQLVQADADEPQAQTAPCVVAVMAALEKKGYPYIWGAKGAHAFDCSGLTYWAYKQAGIDIGVSTYDQAYYGTAINCTIANLSGGSTTCWAPGDLIFLRYNGGQHVAIYAGEGKFMDCYSPAVGCVLHSVEADAFYHAYFWQARRIVSGCEGMTIDPGTPVPSPPYAIESPGVETVPDLVGYVSFSMPTLDSWWPADPAPPSPTENGFIGSLSYGFVWLGWFLKESARESLVGVFWVGQYAANFAALAINACLEALNGLWRLFVVAWLGTKAIFYGAWGMAEDVRGWLASLTSWLAYPRAWMIAIIDLLHLIYEIAVQALDVVVSIVLGLVGLLGWVAGLVINSIMSIISAFTVTTAPAQMSANSSSPIWFIIHGILRGFKDSKVGWLYYVIWGLCYVAFFVYAAKFFNRGA